MNYIFNSYYESQGARILRSNWGNLSRPTTEKVFAYRAYVDRHIVELLQSENLDPEVYNLMTVGLHHEQQHQELLLTDIKYILGNNPLYPTLKTPRENHQNYKPTAEGFTTIAEGLYSIGYQGKDFCWDNELSVHKVFWLFDNFCIFRKN